MPRAAHVTWVGNLCGRSIVGQRLLDIQRRTARRLGRLPRVTAAEPPQDAGSYIHIQAGGIRARAPFQVTQHFARPVDVLQGHLALVLAGPDHALRPVRLDLVLVRQLVQAEQ